ncbi:MAG TPA: DUF4238 domain-containing protein [Nitrospirales bacterium]|nr:DUF4238 domain-containing protein [Nitrospirales bacterium]
MAINSHFIPQFLLKGFSSRRRRNQFYVYVFRTKCTPFSSNTAKIAAQGNFYGDESIESILSEAETKFNDLVLRLREGSCDLRSKPLIDRFVVHSLVRTQTFRDSVHANTESVMNKGCLEFLNPADTLHLLENIVNDGMNQPEFIEWLSRVSPEEKPLLEAYLRELLLRPDMHEKLRQMIPTELAEIDINTSVRSAQRKVLEDERTLHNRIRDLAKIKWDVQMYQRHSLVLGDIGPLVRGDDSPEWGRIFHGTPQEIWLPLSDSCLLKGQVYGTIKHVDSEEVNLVSVENSMEFFVASQRTRREEEYQKRLGLRANQLSKENLSELKRTVREYLLSPGESLSTET